jgi:putative nucleotidyltransferase with HDIG domain
VDLETWAHGLACDALAESLPLRWAHVQGVANRARQAAPVAPGDDALLIAAGLLHDIGYAPDLVTTGFHAIDGARYLRDIDAPTRLVELVAHHSCAVLEAELRGLSAELGEFADEGPTPVRDALWWADMTTTPDGGRTTLMERVREIEQRYGPDDVVSCFVRWGWPELLGAVERTDGRLAAAGVDQEK